MANLIIQIGLILLYGMGAIACIALIFTGIWPLYIASIVILVLWTWFMYLVFGFTRT